MKEKTLLLIGLGALGHQTLQILSRTPTISEGIDKIIAADVNEKVGRRRTNLALLTAKHLGFHPHLEFTRLDLLDVDHTTEMLCNIDPDLIFSAVSLLTWWIPEYLPKDRADRFAVAGLGPFLPMHLALLYNLVRAIQRSNIDATLVNASFPDATAPILNNFGLPYLVGVGNIANLITPIKWVASQKLKMPMRDIIVFMVCHHFVAHAVATYGCTMGAPYYLKIIANGKDVTDKVDSEQKLIEKNIGLPKIPFGVERNSLIAATAVKVLRGILQDTNEITHAPGPNGLIGGYPVRVSRESVEVVLPKELNLAKALKINTEGQKYDGIKEIKKDGTVVLTEKSRRIISEELGYDLKSFKPDESEKLAGEIGEAFKAYGAKWGLPDFALKAIWTKK
ncbi:MAG: hypothetical protein JSV20_07430 [Candidatus Bathyarchaeota archaeon]|nr:MAG: hypothetical protein JSV20_07430 [Candidatus Bathyarchaeota archaeon]